MLSMAGIALSVELRSCHEDMEMDWKAEGEQRQPYMLPSVLPTASRYKL